LLDMVTPSALALRPPHETMKGNVSRQLRVALAKPADAERLIFIDMNLPAPPRDWQGEGVWWQGDAVASKRAVEEQPGNLPRDTTGFVVFTNMPSNYLPLDEFYIGLPQPDGPMMLTKSRSLIWKERSSSTRTSPVLPAKDFRMLRTLSWTGAGCIGQ
jgi:hypothetical protein